MRTNGSKGKKGKSGKCPKCGYKQNIKTPRLMICCSNCSCKSKRVKWWYNAKK